MSRAILIIEAEAERYATQIARAFPELVIHTAGTADEISAAAAASAEALFSFGPPLNDPLIAGLPRLAWLQLLSSGTDSVLRLPSLRPEIVVTSCYGVHGAPVSEMAFLLMLALARHFPRVLRNQALARWEELDQPLLFGKTVAILGTGLIARDLAPRCKAFGMSVVGVSGAPRPLPGFDRILPRSELAEAVQVADFLVVLVPLSAETKGMIDAGILAQMKPGSYLVNLARGDICDEAALFAALAERRIAGAGLDTFWREPLSPDDPFWRLDNVIVTPHIAGRNDCYADLVMPILLANLRCFRDGRCQEMINRRGFSTSADGR